MPSCQYTFNTHIVDHCKHTPMYETFSSAYISFVGPVPTNMSLATLFV